MARRSDQLAAWLTGLGLQRGDSVLLMLGNQVELWDCMLAVIKLGAVVVPTTSAVGSDDLTDRIGRTQARFVIANTADASKFDAVPGDYRKIAVGSAPDGWQPLRDAYAAPASPTPHPGTAPGDRLLLYFTSGTTSRPKLVEHTQASYPIGHLSTLYWIGLQPGDVHLNLSSPGWAKHAWSCFFAPWLAESTVFVYNYLRFEPAALLQHLEAEKINTFCAPPTVWRMLINSDLGSRPSALREVLAAGEPLNPEVIDQVRQRWDLTIRDGYGQTEMTAAIANPPGLPVKPGSMGQALPGVPIQLVDPLTGSITATEGEICIDLSAHPLPLMTGYQGDPERQAEATQDGYYHTGDVATLDSDGYITFVGRTDDVFKASDFKISPFEVESVLIEHPAVAESAVVPAPDPIRLAVVEGLCRPGTRLPGQSRDRPVDPGVRPRTSRALSTRPAARVLRPPEDDLRQDPPGRAAPTRDRRGRTTRTRMAHRAVPRTPVLSPSGSAPGLSRRQVSPVRLARLPCPAASSR